MDPILSLWAYKARLSLGERTGAQEAHSTN